MKNIIAAACFVLLLFFLASCEKQEIENSDVYNYLETAALYKTEDYFGVNLKNKPYILPSYDFCDAYPAADSAVEFSEHQTSLIIKSDSISFYYYTKEMSSSYGQGNGYRIYRYFPDTNKKKLVFSDISLTNFDGFLGLEDIFNFHPPHSDSGISPYTSFFIKDNNVIPGYRIKEALKEKSSAKGYNIDFSAGASFDFALMQKRIFFKDIYGILWCYKIQGESFFPVTNAETGNFFVFADRLFIFSFDSHNIYVCDIDGRYLKTLDSGKSTFARNCINVSADCCYLADTDNMLYIIDKTPEIIKTDIKTESAWNINGANVYIFNGETLKEYECIDN